MLGRRANIKALCALVPCTCAVACLLKTCACAQIVYLEAGHVVEAGSHAELLRKGGKYAELWEQQASTVS